MSLATAVKFRFLAAQLTKKELHQFLDCNTNIIITALFHQILNTSTNQQSEGDNINNAISNIILSRKEKPKPIPTQNIQLDQLPKRLIGEISSFLDQNQNFNFGKTNRFIYLGCNSPNLLKELDLMAIENYAHVNLALYPSVKDLKLNLNKFNELMPAINGLPRSVMNELEAIELNGKKKNDIGINNFLEFTQINTNNVTKLRCSHFGGAVYDYFPADKFMKLLTKFPNIQYLDLCSVYIELNRYHIEIKDLYNLKGLNLITDCDLSKSLIDTFGNNLDFLSFIEFDNDFDFSLQNIDFGKLQELILWHPTNKSMNDILLTAKNLKKIAIVSSFHGLSSVMTPNETKKTMTKLIKTCKSLEFVEFGVNSAADGGRFKYALDGIQNGLKETKKWKRNQMKVRFVVDCDEDDDKFNPNDFMLNDMVKQIVDCLLDSETNDFMLRFSFRNLREKIDTNISLKELKSKYLSTKVKVSCFKHDFVFANTDCKINGFSESWKITLE